ncbi:DNA polymerase III subunit epsilon [Sandaracinobacter sp. RS1-74]|uniref:DNA polymerase III subunit epsilon n=1 Tax=Sandaracinobacteroides sayramensis TaxID=2913411 RepID=UPI001ED9EA70|nr:DNA polymerase III subunit epsilon [Sandaracinobacteroides sayramensis]MCG2841880.1 DNA polymerase III subunit epsilon [Sandaracinobacteroides sayramensis]
MREIVFDTETTGLDPRDGHRLVEFAGVELVERMPTGRHLHFYTNPGRSMPLEAEQVHGLSEEFLRDKPKFREKAGELVAFLGDAILVAHNAQFDMRFLNFELEHAGLKPLDSGRVVDTLDLSRKRFPGAKHTLDALCTRFGIDRSARILHGALIDAELLADVYIELTGGRQIGFDLSVSASIREVVDTVSWPVRDFPLPAEDEAAHRAFLDKMKEPLWRKSV